MSTLQDGLTDTLEDEPTSMTGDEVRTHLIGAMITEVNVYGGDDTDELQVLEIALGQNKRLLIKYRQFAILETKNPKPTH